MQEFFVTVTGKLKTPLDVSTAKEIIKRLSRWDIVTNDMTTVLEAIELPERHKYSFWDSLVIAAAAGGATTILSEDLADSQTLKGIMIKNPFK